MNTRSIFRALLAVLAAAMLPACSGTGVSAMSPVGAGSCPDPLVWSQSRCVSREVASFAECIEARGASELRASRSSGNTLSVSVRELLSASATIDEVKTELVKAIQPTPDADNERLIIETCHELVRPPAKPAYLGGISSVFPFEVVIPPGQPSTLPIGYMLSAAADAAAPESAKFQQFITLTPSVVRVSPGAPYGGTTVLVWAMCVTDNPAAKAPPPGTSMVPAMIQPDLERVVVPLIEIVSYLQQETRPDRRTQLAEGLRRVAIDTQNDVGRKVARDALNRAGLPVQF